MHPKKLASQPLLNVLGKNMARTAEGKVKDAVVKILKDRGAYYFFPVTGGFGRSGVPDVVACYEGQFIGIECKAGTNKPTALQHAELAKIDKAKGVTMVVNENNASWVLHTLDAIDDLLTLRGR
jgi:Holliday junction resolvase